MASIRIRADGGIALMMPQRRAEMVVEIGENETVGSLLARLGLPVSAIQIITVNRAAAESDTAISDGDEIALMPMIVGG